MIPSGGNPIIECFSDLNCTGQSFSFCSLNGSACTTNVSYTCANPGTPQSQCIFNANVTSCTFCNSSCLSGQCLQQNNSNNSSNITHLACINNQCSSVNGSGSNGCSPVGSSCGTSSNTTSTNNAANGDGDAGSSEPQGTSGGPEDSLQLNDSTDGGSGVEQPPTRAEKIAQISLWVVAGIILFIIIFLAVALIVLKRREAELESSVLVTVGKRKAS